MSGEFGGAIYPNGRRYWWKVRLPGDKEPRQIPLKLGNSKFATTDRGTAEKIAAELWQKAIFKPEQKPVEFSGTIASLCQLYLAHCQTYYRKKDGTPTGETDNIEHALKPLIERHGMILAEDFGPLKLIEFRNGLIAKRRENNDRRLCRNVINQRVNIIRRMYSWAVSMQLIGAMTHHALMTVEALKKYRSEARETEDIKPADEQDVFALLYFATKTQAAMIQVQYHTGMRSGELVIMRPCDIDRSGEIWEYHPGGHKTEHLDHDRVVRIGPKAQAVLAPFLLRPPESYCFSPSESCMQGQLAYHKTDKIRSGLTERYSTHTYANAIKQLFQKAKDAGVEIKSWHPHQLRHTAGTTVRRECGRDAAKSVLGVKNSRVIDRYAEIDERLSIEAAKKIG